MTRRVLLECLGILACAVLLAVSCGTGKANADDLKPDPTATATPDATPTPAPAPTPTAPDDDGHDPSEDQLPVTAPVTAPVPTVAATVTAVAPGPVLVQVVIGMGGDWPARIDGAIRNWNRNGRVTLVWVAQCTPGVNCVRFVWASAPDHIAWTDHEAGTRNWQVNVNRTFWKDADTWRPKGTRHLRRATACHELGHVLLGTPMHYESGSGCLDMDVLEDRRYAGTVLLAAVRTGTLPVGMT